MPCPLLCKGRASFMELSPRAATRPENGVIAKLRSIDISYYERTPVSSSGNQPAQVLLFVDDHRPE